LTRGSNLSNSSPRISLTAAARTSLSSVMAASPMPGTSANSASGAFMTSAKEPNRTREQRLG